MARMVAIWRCKCGIGVKVVGEADSTSPDAQQIACPKCRAPRVIYADKIISVTEDTFDGAPAVVSCEEKVRLLVAQNNAFDMYRRMVAHLAEVAGMAAHADFEALSNRVRAAKESLLQTRQQLDEHTAKHGC